MEDVLYHLGESGLIFFVRFLFIPHQVQPQPRREQPLQPHRELARPDRNRAYTNAYAAFETSIQPYVKKN